MSEPEQPMTDDERAYRDLWMAELGRPVPQYHEPPSLPQRVRRQIKAARPQPPRGTR